MNANRWLSFRGLELVVAMLAILPPRVSPGASVSEPYKGWFTFDPQPDPFTDNGAIDLRFLNETFAGEQGLIAVKDGRFVHSAKGVPLRFWWGHGRPTELNGPE